MKGNRIQLSIIILSWNTAKLLKQCLNSLKFEIRNSKFEIIIVDNGSTDGSVEMIESIVMDQLPITIKLIKNKDNLGFTKANNQGIKQACGKYIMLLNSDTIVSPGSIEKLIVFLENNINIGIVGPRLLNSDGSWQANCGKFPNIFNVFVMLFLEHLEQTDKVRWAPEVSGKIDWLMGAAFIARREIFEKVGGLDEKIFMYMEEVDWFYRAKQAGFEAYFLKDAQIVHLGRGSSKSGKKDPIVNIYKGTAYFFQKHKTKFEASLVKIMLKFKAILAIILGTLKNDQYLKETYGEAIKVI